VIIDVDVHPATAEELPRYLSPRWKDYVGLVGQRNLNHKGVLTTQRPFAGRLDAVPEGGGRPGSDPELAREQLLDEYGITWAILNPLDPIASGNAPAALEADIARASNDFILDRWLSADPRWAASVSIAQEQVPEAVAEIERCRGLCDRFIQVLLGSCSERPLGNPRYWPIFEIAEDYGLPIGTHIGQSKYHPATPLGPPNFYYEMHCGFPLPSQAGVASLIFEGVFDRFPRLKFVLLEAGWEWAAPYSWRLDAAWRVQGDEVAHLEQEPSEYFKRHFWFSTQPTVEPEEPAAIYGLYEQFGNTGFCDRLLYSSDYPHWDMDPPREAVPGGLADEMKRRVLGANAAALYGLSVSAAPEIV
jgi:predicted TIM-barrel fold metal-dependent hydrolase